MAPRTRTAKTRAQRIDMEYFKRSHPFRRWRVWLSIAAPAVAVLWLVAMAAAGSRAPYSGGPVAQAHAVFGQRCERCHVRPARAFRAHVADETCLACHDAPAHKGNQPFTPSCASCHLDHRGAVRLAAVDDPLCEQCHVSLKTTDGRRTVAANVGIFNNGHPEFAVKRPGVRDKTALHFNHAVHLKPDLRGPDGPATLGCETCHAAADPATRTEAAGTEAAGTEAAGTEATWATGATVAKVSYARHCAPCHPLFFDPLIDRQAPHDKTDVVHAAVVGSLRDFIAAHPEQIRKPDPPRGRIPVNFPQPFPATAHNVDEWLDMRVTTVERLLWNKTCAECHVMDPPAPSAASPGIPREVPTNMPSRWMPHARFDHRAHRLTTCASCHAAGDSRETSDVLLPAIATCQQCHKRPSGAESRCFECHRYHDWTRAKAARPGFDLRQLTN